MSMIGMLVSFSFYLDMLLSFLGLVHWGVWDRGTANMPLFPLTYLH